MTAATEMLNGATARLAASGRGPSQLFMLEVRGRRSGRTIQFPVVVAEHEGARNDNPKPFIWTKTAEQILESLGQLLQRINGAGH